MKHIKSNFLVVSDYNWLPDNIEESWVHQWSDNYLILDKYHRFEESDRVKRQENVGQNIYDIFDFIYHNYDNLPDVTIFCRAAFLFPKNQKTPDKKVDDNGRTLSNGNCSEEVFLERANNTDFTELHNYGKETEGAWSRIDTDGIGYMEINNDWYFQYHPGRYFNSFNAFLNDVYKNPVLPSFVRFAPGGNYIIPKENMLKYSKNFYQKMREYLGWGIVIGEAHMIERALYTIFTCDWEVNDKYK